MRETRLRPITGLLGVLIVGVALMVGAGCAGVALLDAVRAYAARRDTFAAAHYGQP